MWAPVSLILLSTVTLTIQAASVGQECGKFNEEQFQNKNILTELDEHPWVGRIENKDSDGKNELLCIGILMDARHLVTAAHCFIHSPNDIFSVVFGNADSSDGKLVSSVTIHPDYTIGKPEKDLAIIKLTKDVEFTDFVQPICLPSAENRKNDLIVAGFEGHSYNPEVVRLDKRIKMPFNRTDSNECHKLQKRFSAELICGHAERTPFSGSALVEASGNPRKFHLIGMAVVGFGSPTGRYQGYLNILSNLDWIQQNTSE
ncbi:venom serine protease 34 [Drosophila gunungcola]|uniref:Peptidase S1 domain-containing protein n=1 Tax=Drosophila gunungcola TaxID=103775 RepID=A0A9Q0BVG1_9MUSC|nr:venom serine protease 34 [Drosophila gunungcola]KAI8045711.1 hypothetical protein M5D96_001895 [Drosophila gunungcola]